MRIADGIEMLELPLWWNTPGAIHPTLLWNDEHVVLIDAGFPGQGGALRSAIARTEARARPLSHVLITHHDLDHIGSLATLCAEDSPRVMAHSQARPYIEAERTPYKLTPERMASLAQQKQLGDPFAFFASLGAAVDETFEDEAILSLVGGLEVVHTLGHSPDHVAYFHHPSRVLIAGDALTVHEGELRGPDRAFSYDPDLAYRELKRFLAYDIRGVICYHGGYYEGDVRSSLQALVEA